MLEKTTGPRLSVKNAVLQYMLTAMSGMCKVTYIEWTPEVSANM